MATRPASIACDSALVRAVRIHDENLLVAVAGEFIKRNLLSVWRPRRGASHKRRFGQLHVIEAVRIRDMDSPLTARSFHREG
jgi:hypothetical protein